MAVSALQQRVSGVEARSSTHHWRQLRLLTLALGCLAVAIQVPTVQSHRALLTHWLEDTESLMTPPPPRPATKHQPNAKQVKRVSPSPRPSPSPPSPSPPSPSPSPRPPSPVEEFDNVEGPKAYDDVASFNYGMGVAQVNPKYGFTGKSALVEALEVVLAMGSNMIKFNCDVTKYMNTDRWVNGFDFGAPETTLAQIVSNHPDFRQVFDSPLKYYIFWADLRAHTPLFKQMELFAGNEQALAEEYAQFYELTTYLMNTYQGTGKTFLLGNWEGDWRLLSSVDPPMLKHPQAPAGMIDCANTRQKAIDDAKAASAATGVEVYYYIELNRPRIAMNDPSAPCLTNNVLPYINPDFVSYSAWDSLARNDPGFSTLRGTLGFLQGRLAPKTLTNRISPGKPAPFLSRVFMGEYGWDQGPYAKRPYDPSDAGARAVALAKASFEYNVPFIMYWQLYNNEIMPDGNHRGWWMIDDNNEKQPVYHVHEQFLAKAKAYVTQFKAQTGRVPTAQEYNAVARSILDGIRV